MAEGVPTNNQRGQRSARPMQSIPWLQNTKSLKISKVYCLSSCIQFHDERWIKYWSLHGVHKLIPIYSDLDILTLQTDSSSVRYGTSCLMKINITVWPPIILMLLMNSSFYRSITISTFFLENQNSASLYGWYVYQIRSRYTWWLSLYLALKFESQCMIKASVASGLSAWLLQRMDPCQGQTYDT